MDTSLKKTLVILGAAAIIFFVFKPKADGEKGIFSFGNKRPPIRKPIINDEDLQDEATRIAYEVLCAYIDASNDGVSDSTLQEIKTIWKMNTRSVL